MTTILFFSSFVGLIAIIGSKIFEVKVKKIDFITRLFLEGDKKIHQFIGFVILKYRVYKKIAGLFIFDFLPSFTYEMLVKMKDFVAKKYYEAGTQFRGRRILKSTGSVSFFLERLSEDKSEAESHKA